jgi:hypothetical protein
MSIWTLLLQKPPALADGPAAVAWFDRIAERMLDGCRLMAGKEAHRFIEVEFYYCGAEHLDPFTHRDPLQLECGRWYFHRSRGTYRGGSFKGLDLSFGDGKAYGGVLIRGLETADGTIIDGPSVLVDHLLVKTGKPTIAALDQAIAARLAWDSEGPLYLEDAPSAGSTAYRTARVGLTLKKARGQPEQPRFVLRPYRYLTRPRETGKGKPHMVLALHLAGSDAETIHKLTGCPRRTVERYIADFEAGRRVTEFTSYFGNDLSTGDLCRLHGTWHVHHRPTPSAAEGKNK